ncbi:MAG: calcium-binding protein, partial [Paracoccaceae bacterium]
GDDTYLFRRNDLNGDLISEFEGEGFDTIRFGAGITADEIFFQRTGDVGEVPGLTIFVGEVGAATNVLVASQYDGEFVRPAVEQLELADGTVFDLTEGLTFTGDDNIAGDIEELLGTQFADTILSDAGAGAGAPGVGPNLIAAGAGADRVRGSDGVDSVLGQGDDDLVDLGLGDDTADGGHGVDTLTFKNLVEPGFVFGEVEVGVIADLSRQGTAQNTGQGTDLFIGFENLEGSEYADLLTGDGSANTLMGQEGGDLLIGNAGDDTLEGGEGFDVVEGGPGADFLFGGTGGDVIEGDIAAYFGSAGPLVFDFGAEITEIEASSSAAVRDDVIGDDIEGVAGASDFSNTFNADGLSSLSFFLGGGQADTFNGGSGVDQLIGLRGNDVMYGNDSGDALIGEGGNDELYGGAGADFFFFDGDDDQDTIHDLELGVDVIFFTGGNVAAGDVTFADTDADGNGVTDTVMSYFSSSITVIDHDAAAVEASAVIIFG